MGDVNQLKTIPLKDKSIKIIKISQDYVDDLKTTLNSDYDYHESFLDLKNVFVQQNYLEELINKQQDPFPALNVERFSSIMENQIGTKKASSFQGMVENYSNTAKVSPKNTAKYKRMTIDLKECDCKKEIWVNSDRPKPFEFDTCSEASRLRGKNQKVIVFILNHQIMLMISMISFL